MFNYFVQLFKDVNVPEDIIEVRKGTKKWYYRIKAQNGNVLLTSETYATKQNAIRAAQAFQKRHPSFGLAVKK